jgi:hypothetical protein
MSVLALVPLRGEGNCWADTALELARESTEIFRAFSPSKCYRTEQLGLRICRLPETMTDTPALVPVSFRE